MDKKKIVLIVVVLSLVIILISIILRLSVFTGGSPFESLPSFENGQTTTKSETTGLDPVQSLPIRYNHPAVRGAIVRYILEITLKEVKGKSPDLELVPEVKITDGPKFITNKTTVYFTEKGGKRTPTSTPALKPGQKVKIAIFHDFYRKTWTITGISQVQD